MAARTQRMSLIDDASRAHGVKEVTILTGIALSRQLGNGKFLGVLA